MEPQPQHVANTDTKQMFSFCLSGKKPIKRLWAAGMMHLTTMCLAAEHLNRSSGDQNWRVSQRNSTGSNTSYWKESQQLFSLSSNKTMPKVSPLSKHQQSGRWKRKQKSKASRWGHCVGFRRRCRCWFRAEETKTSSSWSLFTRPKPSRCAPQNDALMPVS